MPEPTKPQIGFKQAGLGTILKSELLEVPPNQREYSWDEEHVTELLQDFAKAVGEGSDHFLGTIVTIPRVGGALEVVDGQQRLATTAILLAAIRDYLAGKDEEVLVESINNEFLTGIDRVKRARVPKLKLNVDDNELFGHIVGGTLPEAPPPTRVSHERLLAAYKQAQKHVKRLVSVMDDNAHGDLLNSWVSFIEDKALAVLLRVPDDANAYRMFETLNDRGLRTSQADLIKNHLFGHAGARFVEVQNRWSYMRGALETIDDEGIVIDFLRHALIVLRGHLREAEVYEAVQGMAKAEQSTATFAAHLETLAYAYVAVLNAEHEKWSDYPASVRSAVQVLSLFNIKPMRPLLLAAATRMEPKEAAKTFNFALSLGVRLIIASTTRSASVEVPLAEAARDVQDGKLITATDVKKALLAVTPSDDEFREAFETARVSNAKLARYYLRSLEMTAKGENDPWFIPQADPTVITLEHVLPKKPEGNWPDVDADAVARNVTRLGNVVLLKANDNSDLKSKSFTEKKPVYEKSPYVLTSQVATCAEWTPEAIHERQKVLATLALKTWPAK